MWKHLEEWIKENKFGTLLIVGFVLVSGCIVSVIDNPVFQVAAVGVIMMLVGFVGFLWNSL
jgi:hypothetical protein